MRLSSEQRDAVVDHARAEHPNECCGVVAVRDGAAVAVHRLENVAASPFRFEVDGHGAAPAADRDRGRR